MRELILQGAVFLEKKQLDILSYTVLRFNIVQIVRDASKHHIAFNDLFSCKLDSVGGKESFTFTQAERKKSYLHCKTVIQTACVFDYVVDDPGGGRSAYDEQKVFLR